MTKALETFCPPPPYPFQKFHLNLPLAHLNQALDPLPPSHLRPLGSLKMAQKLRKLWKPSAPHVRRLA